MIRTVRRCGIGCSRLIRRSSCFLRSRCIYIVARFVPASVIIQAVIPGRIMIQAVISIVIIQTVICIVIIKFAHIANPFLSI